MDLQIIQALMTQGGPSLVVAFIAYKAIAKLYQDMRADNARREEMLMTHLNKVSETLDKIDGRIENMDNRISRLEECVEKERSV